MLLKQLWHEKNLQRTLSQNVIAVTVKSQTIEANSSTKYKEILFLFVSHFYSLAGLSLMIVKWVATEFRRNSAISFCSICWMKCDYNEKLKKWKSNEMKRIKRKYICVPNIFKTLHKNHVRWTDWNRNI